MSPTIVIATDGSELSETAVLPALKLAKPLGARVTFVRVTEPQSLRFIEGILMPYPTQEVERLIAHGVTQQFDRLIAQATEERVAADGRHVHNAQPWRGILEVAEDVDAMMIVMTSHGRSGVTSAVLGSQVQRILANSTFPVLVYR